MLYQGLWYADSSIISLRTQSLAVFFFSYQVHIRPPCLKLTVSDQMNFKVKINIEEKYIFASNVRNTVGLKWDECM